MQQPICKKCKIKPCEKNKNTFRKTCWGCRINKTENSKRNKKYSQRIKHEVISHYGGKCCCCGESIEDFLSIDHIANNGNEFRKKTNLRGIQFFLWVKRNSYPKDLQVLCFNCNWGKYVNGGVCPHEYPHS